jgi:hypothetical protein
MNGAEHYDKRLAQQYPDRRIACPTNLITSITLMQFMGLD